MRAYFFGNMYLSSIQQGIQAAHVVHELFIKYFKESGTSQFDHLFNWADQHKTMILCNAGYQSEIINLAEFFSDKNNPYPWQFFREEQDSLNAAYTSIGIVLPESIYDRANWRIVGAKVNVGLTMCSGPTCMEWWQALPNNYGTQADYQFQHVHADSTFSKLTSYEITLANRISQYQLAK